MKYPQEQMTQELNAISRKIKLYLVMQVVLHEGEYFQKAFLKYENAKDYIASQPNQTKDDYLIIESTETEDYYVQNQ